MVVVPGRKAPIPGPAQSLSSAPLNGTKGGGRDDSLALMVDRELRTASEADVNPVATWMTVLVEVLAAIHEQALARPAIEERQQWVGRQRVAGVAAGAGGRGRGEQ